MVRKMSRAAGVGLEEPDYHRVSEGSIHVPWHGRQSVAPLRLLERSECKARGYRWLVRSAARPTEATTAQRW